MNQDTIVSLVSPPGKGGVAMIRISGVESFSIIEKLFSKNSKSFFPIIISNQISHTIHHGYLFDEEMIIDEVLMFIYINPNSYTGEDIIEISTHGGMFIAKKIIDVIIKSGARNALPGEFTKRAFLNGKLDLSQAEAVADLIYSETESAHKTSINQLTGVYSEYINKIRREIIDFVSLLEVELDFSEENIEFIKKDELKNKISQTVLNLENLIMTYLSGKIIKDGVNLVISGKPNSGKSSLFNYLLKTERAIVSEIKGTTRDYIEEKIIIGGYIFNITDTAGLRDTEDIIESEGIKKTNQKLLNSDINLYLADISEEESRFEKEFELFNKNFEVKKSILVFSKSDLLKKRISGQFYISIYDDLSIKLLEKAILDKLGLIENKSVYGEIIVTNHRHEQCLKKVVVSLKNAVKSIESNQSEEFISIDLRNALQFLGEITGDVTNEDILNNIFSKFCIGK
jgi:tRNA modification GTPase